MRRLVAALTAATMLALATVALAAGASFKTGSYKTPSGKRPLVTFTASKKKITKLEVVALVGECSGPFAAQFSHSRQAGAKELSAPIKKNGTFTATVNAVGGAVTGTVSGRLGGKTATGTLSLTEKLANTGVPLAGGPNTCPTGTLKWTAKKA